MKIIDATNSRWDSKVNFVDHLNTVVGYDTGQDCCEHAGWYISETKRTDTDENTTIKNGLDDYVFDRTFFEEVDSPDVEDGGMVRFRLTAGGKPDLFLHIFNSHNGHYGHGFTVEHSGTIVKRNHL
jgi:hypothetical protein